jgi:hypothetical protein
MTYDHLRSGFDKPPHVRLGSLTYVCAALIVASIALLAGCGGDGDATRFACAVLKKYNIDNDCDGVINDYDRYPGLDDWGFDRDGDGIRDPADRFFGNRHQITLR